MNSDVSASSEIKVALDVHHLGQSCSAIKKYVLASLGAAALLFMALQIYFLINPRIVRDVTLSSSADCAHEAPSEQSATFRQVDRCRSVTGGGFTATSKVVTLAGAPAEQVCKLFTSGNIGHGPHLLTNQCVTSNLTGWTTAACPPGAEGRGYSCYSCATNGKNADHLLALSADCQRASFTTYGGLSRWQSYMLDFK